MQIYSNQNKLSHLLAVNCSRRTKVSSSQLPLVAFKWHRISRNPIVLEFEISCNLQVLQITLRPGLIVLLAYYYVCNFIVYLDLILWGIQMAKLFRDFCTKMHSFNVPKCGHISFFEMNKTLAIYCRMVVKL